MAVAKNLPIEGLTTKYVERFWGYVTKGRKNECWPWRTGSGGYGRFSVCVRHRVYRNYIATRVAYFLGHGVDPGELNVCHKCNNPSCCNPRHLYAGTDADNLGQMAREGRSAKGEQCGAAKLTERDVRRIRQMRRNGMTLTAIATHFGVDHKTIWFIVNYRTWKHVK